MQDYAYDFLIEDERIKCIAFDVISKRANFGADLSAARVESCLVAGLLALWYANCDRTLKPLLRSHGRKNQGIWIGNLMEALKEVDPNAHDLLENWLEMSEGRQSKNSYECMRRARNTLCHEGLSAMTIEDFIMMQQHARELVKKVVCYLSRALLTDGSISRERKITLRGRCEFPGRRGGRW